MANNKTTEGAGNKGFSSRLLLTANTTTYYRAYATNNYGPVMVINLLSLLDTLSVYTN